MADDIVSAFTRVIGSCPGEFGQIESGDILKFFLSEEQMEDIYTRYQEYPETMNTLGKNLSEPEQCFFALMESRPKRDYKAIVPHITSMLNEQFRMYWPQIKSQFDRDSSELPHSVQVMNLMELQKAFQIPYEAIREDEDAKDNLRCALDENLEGWDEVFDALTFRSSPECIVDVYRQRLSPELFTNLATYSSIAKIDATTVFSQQMKLDWLRAFKAAKTIVPLYKEAYESWRDSLYDNHLSFNPQYALAKNATASEWGEEYQARMISQRLFFAYLISTSDDEGHFLFSDQMNIVADSPSSLESFKKSVGAHPYGIAFCNAYSAYCQRFGKSPRFRIANVVNFQLDEENKDEWKMIPGYRIPFESPDDANPHLYGCLSRLFDALNKCGALPRAESKQVFIYRLSGLGGPINFADRILCKNQALLACVVGILYNKSGYKFMSQIFVNEKGKTLNLDSSAAQAFNAKKENGPAQRALQLIKDAGFKLGN